MAHYIHRYVDNQQLPRWILDHPKMIEIWRETNLSVSLLNDLFSLRKEIEHGDIESIVPILVINRGMTIQEAIEVSGIT
jgi:hypothetical protein